MRESRAAPSFAYSVFFRSQFAFARLKCGE